MAEKRTTGLSDAYALKTPDDSRRLYRDWAATYDEAFAVAHDYIYHRELAALFTASGGGGPTLDVGCGTGLLGEALAHAADGAVDGIDISAEMLSAARAKGVYRALMEADLTAALPLDDAAYAGIASAGVFTHGHVGPVALEELLRVARPGAVFALGINEEVFETEGFAAAFAALERDGRITPPIFPTGPIYGPAATHEHTGALFRAAIFRKA